MPNVPQAHLLAGSLAAALIAVAGTLLNAAALHTLLTSIKLKRNPTNDFLISLTVSDLVFCAVCLPMAAIVFGNCALCHVEALCSFQAFFFYWILITMMLNQSAVAFNRFVTICKTHNPPFQQSRRNNLVLIFLTWIFPLIALLLPLTGVWGKAGYDHGTGTCTFIETRPDSWFSLRKMYFVVGLCAPTAVIILCYFWIYVTFKKSSDKVKRASQGDLLQPYRPVRTMARSCSPELNYGSSNSSIASSSNNSQQQQQQEQQQPQPRHDGSRRKSMGAELLRVALTRVPAGPSPECSTQTLHMSPDLSGEGGGGEGGLGQRRPSMAVLELIREREMRREKREDRMTLTLFAISAAYLVCIFPPAIILIIDPHAESHPSWHVPLYVLAFAFGVINPVIYFAFNHAYREEHVASISAIGQSIVEFFNKFRIGRKNQENDEFDRTSHIVQKQENNTARQNTPVSSL